MKIIHVVLNYYPSKGGTQWLFQNISERLVKNYNDEVTVLTVNSYYGPEKKNYKKIAAATEIHNGVKIERFSFQRKHLPFLRILVKLSNRLFKTHPECWQEKLYGPISSSLHNKLQNVEADVVCGSSSAYNYMYYSLERNGINKKPFVFMGAIHFTENKNEKVIRAKTLKAITASEFYIANTLFEKERLIDLGIHENNIVVVGCGVEPNDFINNNRVSTRKQLNVEDDEILIGFVGRQEPLKSIDILMNAVADARKINNKIKLIIAGADSWYTPQLKQMIQHTNENGNAVQLVSNISETEKINLYHAIDVFASASASESFGIVFVEAWACKKPVVASNVGSIRCVVDDEQNGLLSIPFNTKSFAENILLLANNTQLRNTLGNNGYNKMLANYTWDVITEKYRNTYLQAIKKFKSKVA
ncbi:MAG: glycosyltransferase family 4 protein [Bacteroidetes bacterium]|nr:glycosyltransferase family 4 protein [Bacteroidota bacterium]MBS1649677.1 glycosyltransferase family 4 protein [Bacteroidota bacterium]